MGENTILCLLFTGFSDLLYFLKIWTSELWRILYGSYKQPTYNLNCIIPWHQKFLYRCLILPHSHFYHFHGYELQYCLSNPFLLLLSTSFSKVRPLTDNICEVPFTCVALFSFWPIRLLEMFERLTDSHTHRVGVGCSSHG